MQLLTAPQAEALYNAMGPARETSGGSAANTIAGVAAMGGTVGFIGQVADDQLGKIFTHDLQGLGVHFATPPLRGGAPTGRCLILVTPDAQRTMNTCAGASHEITPDALDSALIRKSRILYLEGYFWGPDKPRAVSRLAMQQAHAAEVPVAFTVSDSVCIDGYRDSFVAMLAEGSVDILFANTDEALRLTGAADLESAIAGLARQVPTLVVTRGAQGAIAVEAGERVTIPAAPVDRVVDTTGAGDLFAAGFLFGRSRGKPLRTCLEDGALAAAEIISHFGARPEADLRTLISA